MPVFKAYKFRLYPTEAQKVLMEKHFGCCRFIYNLALETKQTAYLGAKKNLSAFDLIKQMTLLKAESDFEWLNEVNSQSLTQSVVNLDKAYTAFFKGNAKYPNFKNKNQAQSFACPQKTRIDKGRIFLPKFRQGIPIVLSRDFKGTIKTVTVSKSLTGKYFAAVLVDTGKPLPKKKAIKETSAIGIDLGLKSFAAASNGEVFDHPKHLQLSEQRLKVLQRRLSRKKKGSNNRGKAKQKVALLHERIANQRADFLHKLSTKLIRENQTVCIEDLNIKGMVKNHCLAKSIQSSGWFTFTQMLRYKAEWSGKNVITIGRFEPSSKMCFSCGATNHTLSLSDREWVCANCGVLHDRDINAAKNIKAFALRDSRRVSSGEPMELPTMVGAVK